MDKLFTCEYKRMLTNCLHGKAAKRAMLTEITVLQLQSPSSTFKVKYIGAKELKKPSLFNS